MLLQKLAGGTAPHLLNCFTRYFSNSLQKTNVFRIEACIAGEQKWRIGVLTRK
jgi:hypothetical protein